MVRRWSGIGGLREMVARSRVSPSPSTVTASYHTIQAIPRECTGSRVAARDRAQGRIPAVVFTQLFDDSTTRSVSRKHLLTTERKQIRSILKTVQLPFFCSTTFLLQIRAGSGSSVLLESGTVLPIKVHRDPETGEILNLVFVWANEGSELKVDVPVVFKGEDICPGLQKAPSSSPKSSSVDSTAEYNVGDINFFRNRCGLGSQPRLSRQRKLRYLSDREVGISWNNELKEYVMTKSMSLDPSTARFSSVVPHPLPLPERRESGLSSSGNCPLSSPKKRAASRGDAEEGNKTNSCIGDESGDADNPDFSLGSKVVCQTIGKITEHIDTCSAKSPNDHGMKVFQDPNVIERVKKNFRLNVPVTGALTSGFSASDFSGLDMPACSSSHASPQKSISSPNRPLLQSPRFKNRNSKSLSATTPKLHHKLSPESSMTWHEHNGHASVHQLLVSVRQLPLLSPVHPLPLPPGAAPSSQSTYDHRSYYKLEASSMTGQWQKTKLIGRGTFGSVYLAINRETGAFCAMKEVDLIPDDPKSAECIRQLEQEIKVLSQLKHPNIVRYYGSEVVDDHLYIYLEYVHPGSINKYIREHCGAMTESVVRNFTRHILSGLAYLHSTRTIHRDIKGANLLVDASGIVKVADFGMAKHLTGQAAELSLRGSPYWMAPEVIESVIQKSSRSDVALAVDIWSLGCTVIEMLNGKPPWGELEWPAAMFRVLTENPPIPEKLSSEGKDFLRYCFRRNPTERPSASQLLDHPFLRSSQHLDFPGCSRAFSAMKLADKHIFQESASTLQCQSLQAPNSLI